MKCCRYQWISVEDRLPDDDKLYLIIIDYPQDDILLSYYDVANSQFYAEDYTVGVTHWMPLPEPPTSGRYGVDTDDAGNLVYVGRGKK